MAAGITKVANQPDEKMGSSRICVRDVALDNSYPTGGYPITLPQAGMRLRVTAAFCDGGAKNSAGTSLVPVRYDPVNNKLQAYRYDGASAGKAFLEEVAAAVDLSTFTVRMTFIGK